MEALLTAENLKEAGPLVLFILFLGGWFKNQREERAARLEETKANAAGFKAMADSLTAINASVAALAQSVTTMEGAVQASTREVARCMKKRDD